MPRWLIFTLSLLYSSSILAAPPANNTTKTKTKKSSTTLNLAPMLFHVEGNRVKSIEQLNLRELFKVASKAYDEKKYSLSIALYRRILKFFPLSRFRYAALYNLALSYEDNSQCNLAIPYYQQVLKLYPEKKQIALNAKFRIASCYNQLKKWKKAFQAYDQLLQEALDPEDRIDALAYAGESLFHLKRYNEALPLLRLAVAIYLRTQRPKGIISYAAAMAQYYHARIFDLKFRQRLFHLPQSRMKEDLEFKARNLLKALKLYIKTIQLRHADWALAAVYRIGEMYEQMYADMMAAPIPKDLTKEETAIYIDELRKKIKVLLKRALSIYKKGLILADRIGIKSNRWKTKSQQRFNAVLAFYKKYFGNPTQKPTSQPPHTKHSQKPTSKPATQPAHKN